MKKIVSAALLVMGLALVGAVAPVNAAGLEIPDQTAGVSELASYQYRPVPRPVPRPGYGNRGPAHRDSREGFFQGHKYAIFENANSYYEAIQHCRRVGGHLATIDSREENRFLYNFMRSKGYSSAYFGLYREGYSWRNVTGRRVTYMNWHPGEPNRENSNEKYAMFYWKYTDGTWNDGDFGRSTNGGGKAYICEWEPYGAR